MYSQVLKLGSQLLVLNQARTVEKEEFYVHSTGIFVFTTKPIPSSSGRREE